jgi:acetate kinase
MFCYRIRKYVGAYAAVLGGLDGVVFTAGIGENDPGVREAVLKDLALFGIHLDRKANQGGGPGPFPIHAPESRVAVWVVPTNEELQIARETLDLLA